MSIIKFKKRKGDAALFAIVALAVSGVIALGLAKVQHYGFHTLDRSEEFLKAEQFALEASEEIRNTSFAAVAALPKTQISSGTQNEPGKATPSGYYKEVQISRDGIFKDCKVNIYKGDNNTPVLSVNVTKVNPRSLVWGGFTNNTEDSEDETATITNETWSALTTQNFVNGKLINDYKMTDGKGTFTAKASIDYINDKLKNYIEDYKCLKRPAKSGVGTNRQPIFVNNDKLATVCAVNYTLNENTAAPNIGILRKDSSGNITLDYWDYENFSNGTNTPGTTTPDSGSDGGNAGTNINSSENLPEETQWIFDECHNFKQTVELKIPAGVKILCLNGSTYAEVSTNGGVGTYTSANASVKVICNDTSKKWFDLYSNAEGTWNYTDTHISSDGYDTYIGVTPGKTYRMKIEILAETCIDSTEEGADASSRLRIGYSKAINEKVPDITDY